MRIKLTDYSIFIIANLINLLMIIVFYSRHKRFEKVEYIVGLIIIGLIIPLAISLINNVLKEREWWTILLPSLMILYLIIELILDYILKSNFRETNYLWPYITIYYIALIAMIGYSFSIGKIYGLITLGTYFLNLVATIKYH